MAEKVARLTGILGERLRVAKMERWLSHRRALRGAGSHGGWLAFAREGRGRSRSGAQLIVTCTQTDQRGNRGALPLEQISHELLGRPAAYRRDSL